MDLVAVARNIAEGLLAKPLPRRWSHVQAVAAKSNKIRSILSQQDQTVLVAAAWLHDIGYSPSVTETGLHALDGARWLRDNGFAEPITNLVANHSCATYEADERGLGEELRREFPYQQSPLTDALWYADMTTGPIGQNLTVFDRLAEIRERYGPEDVVTRFWASAEPVLVAAVRRTEKRLATAGIQPM
ncbi:MAG TPA: HD domain-containing protein [Micromonosporaceae bacterium]